MHIGCARGSAADQETEIQLAALKTAGCERIYGTLRQMMGGLVVAVFQSVVIFFFKAGTA